MPPLHVRSPAAWLWSRFTCCRYRLREKSDIGGNALLELLKAEVCTLCSMQQFKPRGR
jgi:hypothetical protein